MTRDPSPCAHETRAALTASIPLHPRRAAAVSLFCALSLAASMSAAEDRQPADVPNVTQTHAASAALESTRFLPALAAPSAASATAVGLTFGGYDSAQRAPLLGLGAEVRLWRRLAISGGASYATTLTSGSGMHGLVGVRLQILEQGRHGVDLAAGAQYRQDRFVAEGGLYQALVIVGRHAGRTQLVANLTYGQDGEGDDREGELRCAVLREVGHGLHVGADGRVSRALGSTDPHRIANGTPSLMYEVGPAAVYTAGALAFSLEGGLSGAKVETLQTGLLGLGAVGAVF